MEWLYTLTESSTIPVFTAFLLGVLTSLSPCSLATNIMAIAFIGKDIEDKKQIWLNGMFYALGRTLSYSLLGFVLIMLISSGSSIFGIHQVIGALGDYLLGPLLIII